MRRTLWSCYRQSAASNTDDELDAIGVDFDVVEMTFANPDSAYS